MLLESKQSYFKAVFKQLPLKNYELPPLPSFIKDYLYKISNEYKPVCTYLSNVNCRLDKGLRFQPSGMSGCINKCHAHSFLKGYNTFIYRIKHTK